LTVESRQPDNIRSLLLKAKIINCQPAAIFLMYIVYVECSRKKINYCQTIRCTNKSTPV